MICSCKVRNQVKNQAWDLKPAQQSWCVLFVFLSVFFFFSKYYVFVVVDNNVQCHKCIIFTEYSTILLKSNKTKRYYDKMFIFKLWFAGCVRESIALYLNVRLRSIVIRCLFSNCVCCGLQGVSGRV